MPDGPLSAADRLLGLADSPGGAVWRAAVRAAPAAGRANEALLRLLARRWDIPRRELTIVAGHKSRGKLVHAAGEKQALLRRIAALPCTAERQ